MLFSEKLKKLRKDRNYTQEELAEKLNVSRQAITKWESSEGIADIENLKQISILFNITIDELIKEDKELNVEVKYENLYVEELEIDHTKHFDININQTQEINIKPNIDEKVKIEILSNDEIKDKFKIKIDNLYNRLDIDIKNKILVQSVINLYLPQKYIDEIELKTKSKILNITNLEIKKLEYDGALKYLNVKSFKGIIVLNATKSDVEVNYDIFDGKLEINSINSVSRIELPKNTKYKTILKGIKNEFVNASITEETENIIELNGINSKAIIIEK